MKNQDLYEKMIRDRARFSGLATACRVEAEKQGIEIPRGTQLAGFQGAAVYYCGLLKMDIVEADRRFNTKAMPTVEESKIEAVVETQEEAEARRGVISEAGANITGGMLVLLVGLFFIAYMILKRGK